MGLEELHHHAQHIRLALLHSCARIDYSFCQTGISKILRSPPWHGCTFSNNFFWALALPQGAKPQFSPVTIWILGFTVTEAAPSPRAFARQLQASVVLHDSFMTLKPAPPGKLLHITKSGWQQMHIQPESHLGHSFCVPNLRKPFQNFLSQWRWSLLNLNRLFSPRWSEPQIFNLKYHSNRPGSFCWVLFVLFLIWFFFQGSIPPYTPSCPGTHSVNKVVFEFRDSLVSASWVLGLKACTTILGSGSLYILWNS